MLQPRPFDGTAKQLQRDEPACATRNVAIGDVTLSGVVAAVG